jgi:hypothetical protein
MVPLIAWHVLTQVWFLETNWGHGTQYFEVFCRIDMGRSQAAWQIFDGTAMN